MNPGAWLSSHKPRAPNLGGWESEASPLLPLPSSLLPSSSVLPPSLTYCLAQIRVPEAQWETSEFGAEKVYCRVMQGDVWLMPPQNRELPGFSKAVLKAR